MKTFDVVIIGGGMVGAALALGWAKQGHTVALVEGHSPQKFAPEQPMDVRISAISKTSVDLLNQLGAWEAIKAMRVCPYRGLETWEHPDCRTRFHSDDLGIDLLGYMVENRVIQLGLWAQFAQHPNLTLFCPERLDSITGDERKRITLESGEVLEADWVVGADGANSKVRQCAHIGVTVWDYRQHCMLINVETAKAQQDVTWQQFFPSGPRSFLPLNGHQGSLVWYDSPARIRQLSSQTPNQLREEILAHFPAELGDIKVLDKGSFPLTRRHAQKYVSHGCVLVGDSAHTINPLAGQGVNLGFKDVAVLLEETAKGSALTLSQFQGYERRRRPDNLLMQSGMDFFYKTFSNELPPLRAARNALLKVAENAGPIKKQVLRYALGL
ncbi:2-octaprenyl-3-methyl-6-methoxy-1,4-benzoquinol hydroxylase [Vibrio nitrifigilis]|uniref:2-octaprenyl-3-methyl-6-methoxy-1,4-benzoquinol hydroxylase n=1 Tax=Vibrio nitrifigilis TaxID=2789781 RepID=A0ABS0GBZ3_9VIBR|nr:2-octaprenyl-3-methyl-6-methoxy-1,4-benzoquinol hydroxylase [Vibrio nitrifigilis]MBF8999798.1 2-octaprenyl-3-methyl-6-methoxy-1,4-benzoquinol hydroxylase [Vibrio nitrifigilis]